MKFSFSESTAIKRQAVLVRGLSLTPYMTTLQVVIAAGGYGAPEASLNVLQDEDMLLSVHVLADSFRTNDLRYIFVIGIGGSNLGTKAIYDALYQSRDMVPHTKTKLIFVDTNEAALLTACRDLIWSCTHKTECLLVSISKSGGTTETLTNTEILLGVLREKWKSDLDRLVVIADGDSLYVLSARAKGIATLTVPTRMGGRYSVLSTVGLFPLALLGLPIDTLHQGAADMLRSCLNFDIALNPAAQSAIVLDTQYQAGKTIHDTFVFGGQLESLGKWYRQLLGESIGKEKLDTTLVGITPTVSVGSTDLHSIGQLVLGGPRDKVTTFVYDETVPAAPQVPTERQFPELIPMISGKSVGNITAAILAGTKHAYNTRGLPFMEMTLEGVTLAEIGAFMQFKMIEVMFLGHLLGVSPFDQPAVESYKIETKRLLEN